MRRLIASLALVAVLLPVSASAARFDRYEWSSPAAMERFGYAFPRILGTFRIKTDRMAGLRLSDGIVAERGTLQADEALSYLRTEGGRLRSHRWIVIRRTAGTQEVRTAAQLAETFGPVDTEAKAVSFAAAVQGDLHVRAGIPYGHVTPVEGGYLVHLFSANTFSCGPHYPTGVLTFVSTTGEMEEVARQRITDLGGHVCVD